MTQPQSSAVNFSPSCLPLQGPEDRILLPFKVHALRPPAAILLNAACSFSFARWWRLTQLDFHLPLVKKKKGEGKIKLPQRGRHGSALNWNESFEIINPALSLIPFFCYPHSARLTRMVQISGYVSFPYHYSPTWNLQVLLTIRKLGKGGSRALWDHPKKGSFRNSIFKKRPGWSH